MADGPTHERVERILALLAQTTGTGVDYFYPEPRRRPGLLDGEGILDIWRAFQEDDPKLSPFKLTTQRMGRKEPYGFYFLFYVLDGPYPSRIEHFELARAAATWPENGRGKASLGPPS